MIKEIAFTVYAVTDMKVAREFYEQVLGLVPAAEFNGEGNGNWIEYNIGSSTFSIGCSPDWKPSADGASIAFEVDDFESTIASLKEKNVPFKMEPMDFPSCQMAVVKDPDGSSILIHKIKAK